MRDDRFWSNSAKYVGENLAPCHANANLHGRVSLHPHAATFVPTKHGPGCPGQRCTIERSGAQCINQCCLTPLTGNVY